MLQSKGDNQMDQTTSTLSANTLQRALEPSKNSWLLAIQFRDREQPSLYPIEGSNTEKLMAKLTAARDCWAKVSVAPLVIMLCYEVVHAAFCWECRVKNDRCPAIQFLGTALQLDAVHAGDPHVTDQT